MNESKVKSYYGFALKSNNLVVGVDNILKKKCSLIVLSKALAQNSKNKCYAKYGSSAKIVEIENDELCRITDNSKILAFGIIEKNLSNALLDNLN